MKELKQFLSSNKKIIIFTFLILFALYYFKLFFYGFSIDTEQFISNKRELLNSWIAIDRSGLVLLKSIFDVASKSLILANIISFLLNFLTTIIYLYIFQILFKSKNNKIVCEKSIYFILIFLTSPFLLEQYNFTLQNVEISIALLLSAINMYIINKLIVNKNLLFGIISVTITGFIFSCYQSFMLLFIVQSIIIFISYFQNIQISFSNCFKIICKFITIMILGFIICKILNYIFLNIYNLDKGSYLTSNFLWGKEPIFKSILRMGYIIFKLFFYPSIFNIIFIGVYFILWLYYIKKSSNENNIFKSIVIFGLFITPFLIIIFTANIMAYRAHITISFLLAFCAYYFPEKINFRKLIRIINLTIIIFQSSVTLLLFSSDYLNFQEEKKLAYQIEDTLSNYDLTKKSVVFIGDRTSKNVLIKGETIGKSFYEWDYNDTITKSNNRINGFLQSLNNFSYILPTIDDVNDAEQYKDQLEIFPKKNSVIETDKYIVVRLK